MRKFLIALTLAITATTAVVSPAEAQRGRDRDRPHHGGSYRPGGVVRPDRHPGTSFRPGGAFRPDGHQWGAVRPGQRYRDNFGRYQYRPFRVSRNDRFWRGSGGRWNCRRPDGTTGLLIGAAGGALVGNAVETQNGLGTNGTTGTVVGALLGGLLGREIDRGNAYCR